MIAELLEKTALEFKNLDAIVLSAGPGSYTGLRIGSSAAKAMCYALNIPLIAVSSHGAMFENYVATHSIMNGDNILCMTDARRNEAYCTLYSHQGEVIMPTQAIILDNINFLQPFLQQKLHCIGSGAFKMKEHENNNSFILEQECLDARALLNIGKKQFEKKQFENIFEFEPNYLKPFFTTAKIIEHFNI